MTGPKPTLTEADRLASQVNALIEVIRDLVFASRPGTPADERERAWRNAAVIAAIDETRNNNPEFMARLQGIQASLRPAVSEPT